MNVWIYDENSYPSRLRRRLGAGADARVARARAALCARPRPRPKWRDRPGGGLPPRGRQVRERHRARSRPAKRCPRAATWSPPRSAPATRPGTATGATSNLLYPGVTEKFLEVTLEAYEREIGEQFGKRVPGVFTDEPQHPPGRRAALDRRPAGAVPEALGLQPARPPAQPDPAGRRLAAGPAQLLPDCSTSCSSSAGPSRTTTTASKHGLEFTGHYWDHEWPNCVGVPDNMAMSAWQQRPGHRHA